MRLKQLFVFLLGVEICSAGQISLQQKESADELQELEDTIIDYLELRRLTSALKNKLKFSNALQQMKQGTNGHADVPNSDIKKECGSNRYAPTEDRNICYYRECRGQQWSPPIRCKDGVSVSKALTSGRKILGKPCTTPNKKCKLSLADKGVGNVDVNICGIDLIWVVDISCSIEMEDKQKVKNFIRDATSKFPIRPAFTSVGALAFSEKIYDIAFLNSYLKKSQLLNAIGNMPLVPDKCSTATYEALRHTREEYLLPSRGNRPDYPDVVIVVTDGVTHPPSRAPDTIKEAQTLKALGVNAFVIALPNIKLKAKGGNGMDEWMAIASKKENIYSLDSFDALRGMIDQITSSACKVI